MKKLLSVIVVMAFVFAVFGVEALATDKKEESEKPAVKKGRLVERAATVESIDADKRMVTLKGVKGNMFSVKVDEDVDLSKVKAGDNVITRYYESIAIQVKKPGESEAGAQVSGAVATSKPGEKPAEVTVNQVTVTTTIEAIDKANQGVTLKDPTGKTRTIKVENPKHLEDVAIGDKVVITYTEALAISVEKSKK
jgi:hypothetical protein